MTTDQNYPQAVLQWLDTRQPSLSARRTLRLWHAIDDELSPLVGASGFIALYGRCVDICGADHPWLRRTPAHSPPALCFDTLAAQLAARSPAEALAGSCALFRTFYELLLQLLGAPLSAGVLDAAWHDRLLHQPLLFAVESASPPVTSVRSTG